MEEKPKRGRPFSGNPKDERIFIRVTGAEKAEIMTFCKAHDTTCLQLIKKGMVVLSEVGKKR